MIPIKFTLGQASRETGISKATLSRDIRNGKFSALKLENGIYEIDPAELFRVYPRIDPDQDATGSSNPSRNDPQPQETGFETGGLQAEVKRLSELLQTVNLERSRERDQLVDQIEDLRRRLDSETEERKGLMLRLLTDQRESQPTPPSPPPMQQEAAAAPAPAPTRPSLWSLFGRRGG